jgi:hypothetical protein
LPWWPLLQARQQGSSRCVAYAARPSDRELLPSITPPDHLQADSTAAERRLFDSPSSASLWFFWPRRPSRLSFASKTSFSACRLADRSTEESVSSLSRRETEVAGGASTGIGEHRRHIRQLDRPPGERTSRTERTAESRPALPGGPSLVQTFRRLAELPISQLWQSVCGSSSLGLAKGWSWPVPSRSPSSPGGYARSGRRSKRPRPIASVGRRPQRKSGRGLK